MFWTNSNLRDPFYLNSLPFSIVNDCLEMLQLLGTTIIVWNVANFHERSSGFLKGCNLSEPLPLAYKYMLFFKYFTNKKNWFLLLLCKSFSVNFTVVAPHVFSKRVLMHDLKTLLEFLGFEELSPNELRCVGAAISPNELRQFRAAI